MKNTTSLRQQVLKQIIWDYSIQPEEVERILSSSNISEKKSFYLKLLSSVSWYTLKNILSEKELGEALSPDIISLIHIPTLREKYQHVRRLLY